MSRRTRALVGFVAVAIGLNFVPGVVSALEAPGFYITFLFSAFFWIGQAASWNILTGFTGYFSFGQGAWFGIGVYTTGILAGKQGWPFMAALPVAGVLAGVFGLLLGLVVFRLRKQGGEIFALTTLAIAFVLAALARLYPFIDGGRGVFMTGTPLPEFLGDYRTAMFRLTFVVAFLTVLTAYLIYESRLGWGMFAIRDDEQVAHGLGVPTFRYKMFALLANSFFSGLMGGVWALQIGFVTVDDVFNIRVPLFVILMSVLGGLKHWMGPVVGAVIIYTLTDRLNSAGLEDVNQVIIGGLLILLVLAVREGVYLRLRSRWKLALSVFAVAMVVLIVTDIGSSLIWDFAYASLATLLAILLPIRGRQAEIAPPAGVEREVPAAQENTERTQP